MAQNTYECLFLLDSNRYAKDPGGVSGSIPTMIQAAEGEVLASRLYNEQKLAYQIEGHKKGTYWLTYFRMEGAKMGELNRACQLNGAVLRHMAIKLDERVAPHLVAAARGETIPGEEEPATEDATKPAGEPTAEPAAEPAAETAAETATETA